MKKKKKNKIYHFKIFHVPPCAPLIKFQVDKREEDDEKCKWSGSEREVVKVKDEKMHRCVRSSEEKPLTSESIVVEN